MIWCWEPKNAISMTAMRWRKILRFAHFSGNPLSFMSGNESMKMTIIYIREV